MDTNIKRIIEEICKENNIKIKFLSKDWVTMLEKNGKTKFISGYNFGLDSHALGSILDDKYALYDVLREKGIPVIEHNIVYSKTNHFDYAKECNTYEYVKNYFKLNNNHIVIKPNNGSCGHDVYNVTNINEIDNILDKLFASHHSISICPFYSIKHEYRTIMLDGEVQLSYMKISPTVIGDGIKTIRELLLEFNYGYFVDRLNTPVYDKVLNKDEIYNYNWKFNLSQGAIAKEIDDNLLLERITNMAKKISNEIGLNFGSIDIIETIDGDFFVLEINSGVMLENFLRLHPNEYETIKNIYKKAIEELF